MAARADAELVKRGYQKTLNHQPLNREERSALRRHEGEKEERLRWQYYRSIPQKHWRAMSGRQTKVINEQADRYGLPFGGPTIDLTKLARGLHEFLAKHARKLSEDDETDPLLQGGGSPALERYREERAALARLDRLQRETELIPREQVRTSLGRIAAIVRNAGDTLQRQFGHAALDLLHEALDDAQREIDRSFGGDAGEAASVAEGS